MANASLKTAATDKLRVFMIQRQISVEGLALSCGMATVTIRNQIAKNFPSRRLRVIVEDVLGQAIWSNPTDFEARQKLSSKCGFDLFSASVPRLKKVVSALKIRGRGTVRKKKILIQMLQDHFTIQTNNQNDQP